MKDDDPVAGYGYRRVTKALVRAGWKVNHQRAWRVMRQAKQKTVKREDVYLLPASNL